MVERLGTERFIHSMLIHLLFRMTASPSATRHHVSAKCAAIMKPGSQKFKLEVLMNLQHCSFAVATASTGGVKDEHDFFYLKYIRLYN